MAVIVSVVGGSASLTAVLLGIDQLASGARLRNLEATLRAVRGTTENENREAVLASVHAATVAKLLARNAVPAHRFAAPAAWSVASAAAIAWMAFRPPAPELLFGSAAGAVGLSFSIVELVRLGSERGRVARCYRRGVSPIRAFPAFRAVPSSRLERVISLCIGLGYGAVALGLQVLIWSPQVSPLVPPGLMMVFGSVLAGGGAMAFAFGVGLLRMRVPLSATDDPEALVPPIWEHPDPEAP